MDRRSFLKSAVGVPVAVSSVSGGTKGITTDSTESPSASTQDHTDQSGCDVCHEYDKLNEEIKRRQPKKSDPYVQYVADELEEIVDPQKHTFEDNCKFKNTETYFRDCSDYDVSATVYDHAIMIDVTFDCTDVHCLSKIQTVVESGSVEVQ